MVVNEIERDETSFNFGYRHDSKADPLYRTNKRPCIDHSSLALLLVSPMGLDLGGVAALPAPSLSKAVAWPQLSKTIGLP